MILWLNNETIGPSGLRPAIFSNVFFLLCSFFQQGDGSCTPGQNIPTSSSTTMIADTDASSSSPFLAIWTDEQWAAKKEAYPWLDCKDGKLGCKFCSSVPSTSITINKFQYLSDHWCRYNIAPSGEVKEQLMASLRKKIQKHKLSQSHKAAEKIQASAKKQSIEKYQVPKN